MTVEEAMSSLTEEMANRKNLNIVAISGPGEPLYNEATFVTLEKVRESYPRIKICLSTNGILLQKSVDRLSGIGVDTISVSMSAIRPDTISRLYRSAVVGTERLEGEELGQIIPKNQLSGIQDASENGISVKVNTILIPQLNQEEIPELSRKIEAAGANLQNIVPLIPRGAMCDLSAPSLDELYEARRISSAIIPQFRHCKQCRSDVVGIPGCDRVLT
jgi:nitrogen fixation protein NifB